MESPGSGKAFFHNASEIDRCNGESALGGSQASGAEDLFDGGEEAVAVIQHDAVELVPLRLGNLVFLECLEVQPDGGYWGFELVGDRVDEGVVLFVSPDLPN